MDDIREDELPEQTPASAGEGRREGKVPGVPRVVGPESETRGGPEAPDEVLSEPRRQD
jgi:hypothetical protein